MHDDAYIGGHLTLNASCMTISGERTEQLDIFCRVTGFTSDFPSFIDVELIRFSHGALLIHSKLYGETCDCSFLPHAQKNSNAFVEFFG